MRAPIKDIYDLTIKKYIIQKANNNNKNKYTQRKRTVTFFFPSDMKPYLSAGNPASDLQCFFFWLPAATKSYAQNI